LIGGGRKIEDAVGAEPDMSGPPTTLGDVVNVSGDRPGADLGSPRKRPTLLMPDAVELVDRQAVGN
jgi:hypothetical protein